MKPAAKALLGKLRAGGLYVRGAEVRAARELVGLGLAILTDNGAIRGLNSERWSVEFTSAGQAYPENLPTILVTKLADGDGYHAAIAGSGGKRWGRGKTSLAAIGNLVGAHADALGLKIVWPKMDEEPLDEKNTGFIKRLLSAEAVVIAGEAASHSVFPSPETPPC